MLHPPFDVPSFRLARPGGLIVLLHAVVTLSAQAQTSTPPVKAGPVTVAVSFRTRVEGWNWFGDGGAGEYVYPGSLLRAGFSQTTNRLDWQVELAAPFLLGLPDDAVAPGAAGALGLGANYFAANDGRRNAGHLFVKQAAVRFKRIAGVAGQSLRVGRFEFIDGAEMAPTDATLAALKRDRIAHRLIGNFGFSHAGRSVDGVQYGLDRGGWNITALVSRPTRGVFDVDGWANLPINLVYGAVTRRLGSTAHAAEWRAFAIDYEDHRDTMVKVDNRALATRRDETSGVTVTSFGGHYLRADRTANGTFDLLAWGVAQTGKWGELSHRAGAIAIEGGWQPQVGWAPWFRGGWNYGSGDGDANDGRHGTFFQLLPTPRIYARLPFFNMMNVSDTFGEAILRPSRTVTLRADVHALRLAGAADLWYQGGGAFEKQTFGYAGRPSNGRTALATLADLSADLTVSPNLTVSGYYGRAVGRAVTDAIYGGGGARLAYLELLIRF